MYVVVGTAFGNKTVHGPFTRKEAEEWVEQTGGADAPCDIVPLRDRKGDTSRKP